MGVDTSADEVDTAQSRMPTILHSGDSQQSAADAEALARNIRYFQSRKVRKPLMEKKRRARINDSLEQLKKLLLIENNDQSRSAKLDKADVLEMAVRHLQRVHQERHPDAENVDPNPMRPGYEPAVDRNPRKSSGTSRDSLGDDSCSSTSSGTEESTLTGPRLSIGSNGSSIGDDSVFAEEARRRLSGDSAILDGHCDCTTNCTSDHSSTPRRMSESVLQRLSGTDARTTARRRSAGSDGTRTHPYLARSSATSAKFRAAFSDCAQEARVRLEQLPVDSALGRRLSEHLLSRLDRLAEGVGGVAAAQEGSNNLASPACPRPQVRPQEDRGDLGALFDLRTPSGLTITPRRLPTGDLAFIIPREFGAEHLSLGAPAAPSTQPCKSATAASSLPARRPETNSFHLEDATSREVIADGAGVWRPW